MSYIFSICLLTTHISISLYKERRETSSPCLPAHLSSIASKLTKNNKTLTSGFDHYFFIKLLGAVVLFVQAYHL